MTVLFWNSGRYEVPMEKKSPILESSETFFHGLGIELTYKQVSNSKTTIKPLQVRLDAFVAHELWTVKNWFCTYVCTYERVLFLWCRLYPETDKRKFALILILI